MVPITRTKIINPMSNKIILINDIIKLKTKWEERGLIVGLCHGVFDLLHPGHLRHLSTAKKSVDILIVSITADSKIFKGPGRPVFNEKLRAESLSFLETVSYVVVVNEETALPIIKLLKPKFYFKGNDYKNNTKDLTGNIKAEVKEVKKYGGKIIYTNEIEFSSSKLINNYIGVNSYVQNQYFKKLRKKYNFLDIENFFQRLSKLKVLIIGETIFDQYTYSEALGKSSKDPILCLNTKSKDSLPGGVLAVALNCFGLGAQVTVLTGINKKDLKNKIITDIKNKGIKIEHVDISPKPTIIKNRIVDERTNNKVIELYSMDDTNLSLDQVQKFRLKIKSLSKSHDLIIITDYGHGLIDEGSIKIIDNINKFKCLNVQSNAGNRGFNHISKYKNANLISLNGNELRLEARRKHLDLKKFVLNLNKKMNTSMILITQGSLGIDILNSKRKYVNYPSMTNFVHDRVGAGDAVLCISSLLHRADVPTDVIGLCGNLTGAWATSFIGNKKMLTKEILLKQMKSIFTD